MTVPEYAILRHNEAIEGTGISSVVPLFVPPVSIMTSNTFVQRHATVAYFELIANNESYKFGQIAQSFIILDVVQPVPPTGPAELIIRSEGKDPRHRQIEIIGSDPAHPERISIRRS